MSTETRPPLPFVPYEGTEPYVFVSYAHKDADMVYPVIGKLHGMGYRLWYDEGIEVGDKWFKVVCDHLRQSACMLLFWSSEAEKSQWVGKEILIALNSHVRIAGSVIDSAALPDELVDVQMLFYGRFDSEDAFIDKLCKGLPRETKKTTDELLVTAPPPETETPSQLASPPEDFEWKLEGDGTATVMGYRGEDSNVVIPSTYLNRRVSAVWRRAFHMNVYIETVTIPEGIIYIGDGAFFSCVNLKTIYLPKSLCAIDDNTFIFCESLNNVTIPRGVGLIGADAFSGCDSLTDISIPASVTSISKDAFGRPNPALIFHCLWGSYAERYARQHNIKTNGMNPRTSSGLVPPPGTGD